MTLQELRWLYRSMRRKYFVGLGLPPVGEVRFHWASDLSLLSLQTELACVSWEGKTCHMEFHPMLKSQWLTRLCTLVLLHEMAHVHNRKADHGPWFDKEAQRLGALGALREFWT